MIYRCNEWDVGPYGYDVCNAPATKFDPRFGRRRLYCDYHGASDDLPIWLIDRMPPEKRSKA